MDNIHVLCEEVRQSLEEARIRLRGIVTNPNSVIDQVQEACLHDYRRCKKDEGGRFEPVTLAEKALNFIPDPRLRRASIELVDASTRFFGGNWSGPINIQAKSFRPYLPFNSQKNEKNYRWEVKTMLHGKLSDPGDIAEKITATKMGEDGMYVKEHTDLFNAFAPKICLVYSISLKHRRVFMLRPSAGNLNNISYRVYCYVVMSSLLKRRGGTCDLMFWNKLSDDHKRYFHKSMWVPDSMLVVRQKEIQSYPLIGNVTVIREFPEISSPDLMAA